MNTNNKVISSLSKRRSIYTIGNNVTLNKGYISEIIMESVRLSPSAFNSQSSRALILFDEHHHKLWKIVKYELSKILSKDELDNSASKIDSCFSSGFGTVLFFEDEQVLEELKKSYPSYNKSFDNWAEQGSGMAQLAVWTALSEEDLGATIQHYNPLIDKAVSLEWKLPMTWRLKAQMPFGTIEQSPREKTYIEDSTRFITYL